MESTTTPPAPEPTAPKATKNVLRIREIVALHEWVTAHVADCRTQTDPKLAAIAQAELEFTVTAANIAGMRAEIGIEKAKKEAPPSLEERLAALEQDNLWMKNALMDLRGIVTEMDLRSRVVKMPRGVGDLENGPNLPPPADHPVLPCVGHGEDRPVLIVDGSTDE